MAKNDMTGNNRQMDKNEKHARYGLIEYCSWGISATCLPYLTNYCSTRPHQHRLNFNAYSVKERATEDLMGLTPLTAACGLTLAGTFARQNEEESRLEIVRSLLQSGANPNFQPTYAFWISPLMIASWIGYKKITELLLQHQADPNYTDRDNSTALIFAANKGHVKIVEQLLEADADAEIVNVNGMSAIHCAVARAHIPVIKALMNKQGITPDEIKLIEKNVFQTAAIPTASPTIIQNTYPPLG